MVGLPLIQKEELHQGQEYIQSLQEYRDRLVHQVDEQDRRIGELQNELEEALLEAAHPAARL